MRRSACLLALVAALLSGCGGSSGPGGQGVHGVLADTSANLAKIKSGVLGFSLLVSPRENTGGSEFGYELHGPFALAKAGSLPVIRIAYTQIASGKRATVTVISTGQKGFVSSGGKTYELRSSALDRLRGVGNANDALSVLQIDDWVEHPRQTSCGSEAGPTIECIVSGLNVVNTANDLLVLGGQVRGTTLPTLKGADAKQVRDAVKSASMRVATGKKDRLLRSLVIDVEFKFGVPQQIQTAIGKLVGAHVHFALSVGAPNQPVHVAAPQGALPYSQLSSAR